MNGKKELEMKISENDKRYMVGVCKTTDMSNGKDILPPYYKVYSVEIWNGEPPTVWFEAEFDTLKEAKDYIKEKEK